MSGAAGMRGYVVQTLACILDACQDDESWLSVQLEPSHELERFDIVWNLAESRQRATQVKSSERQMNLAMVKSWVAHLSGKGKFVEMQLLLIGPVSKAVAALGYLNGVSIPAPRPLDRRGMLIQIAHGADLIRDRLGFPSVGPRVRIRIAQSLYWDFSESAIDGKAISRSDLIGIIETWLRDVDRRLLVKRARLVIDAPYDKIAEIIRRLEEFSGDYSLEIKEVKRGSIALILEGTSTGIQAIVDAGRRSQLSQIVQFPVLSCQVVDHVYKRVHKRASQWLWYHGLRDAYKSEGIRAAVSFVLLSIDAAWTGILVVAVTLAFVTPEAWGAGSEQVWASPSLLVSMMMLFAMDSRRRAILSGLAMGLIVGTISNSGAWYTYVVPYVAQAMTFEWLTRRWLRNLERVNIGLLAASISAIIAVAIGAILGAASAVIVELWTGVAVSPLSMHRIALRWLVADGSATLVLVLSLFAVKHNRITVGTRDPKPVRDELRQLERTLK